MTFKHKTTFYIAAIILLAISSCKNRVNKSIKMQAESASASYCNCVKENIFRFKYSEELFAYCNKIVKSKFRLYSMYLDSNINAGNSDNLSNDSVKLFMDFFTKAADSCGVLPVVKYPKKI